VTLSSVLIVCIVRRIHIIRKLALSSIRELATRGSAAPMSMEVHQQPSDPMGDLRVTAKSQEENGFIYNEIG
jgi:hypothetical protein